MTEYLIAARAAIILCTSLAMMPAEIVFDAIEAELDRRDVELSRPLLRPYFARAVWNGIAVRTKPRRTPSFIFGQRE